MRTGVINPRSHVSHTGQKLIESELETIFATTK